MISTFSLTTNTNTRPRPVVNNVIRLYRGNFPVPFIRSLVIMQPVRNQFELLKFQLTATLCGGGREEGRGGEGRERGQVRERKQVPHWALLSLVRVSRAWLLTSTSEPQARLTGPPSPPATAGGGGGGGGGGYYLHNVLATLQYYSIKNCLASLSLTELLSLNLNNEITYTTYVCTWLIKTHTSLVFCCIWWKILLKGKFCCKISMTRYVTL